MTGTIRTLRFAILTAVALAANTLIPGANAMATEKPSTEPVTLINSFEVPENRLEETIVFWEKARDFLNAQPGYISTRLHRSLSPDAKFRLVNVARWQSPQAFQAAMIKMRESELGADMRGTVFHAALYEVIRED